MADVSNLAPLRPAVPVSLSPLQLYELFWRASGGVSAWAVAMGAIALRESRGIPTAFNGNSTTGDRSYGLVQINMLDKDVAAALNAGVLKGKQEAALLDAATNAAAAWQLTNHSATNMNLAWYIYRNDGTYKHDYESYLPVMMQAALQSKLGWIAGVTPATPAQVV